MMRLIFHDQARVTKALQFESWAEADTWLRSSEATEYQWLAKELRNLG